MCPKGKYFTSGGTGGLRVIVNCLVWLEGKCTKMVGYKTDEVVKKGAR